MVWESVELSTGRVYYCGPEPLRRIALGALRSGPLGLFRVVFDFHSGEIIGCANPAPSMIGGPDGETLIDPDRIRAMMKPESKLEYEQYLARAAKIPDRGVECCRVQYAIPGFGDVWLTHVARVLVRDPDGSPRLLVTDLVPDF